MTKREIRRKAHKRIFINGQSHQETFDQLHAESKEEKEFLAKLISVIPSKQLHEKTNVIWFIYVALLVLLILMRSGYILINWSFYFNEIPTKTIVLTILLVVAFPVYGIIGAFRGWTNSLSSMGIIAVLGLFNLLKRAQEFRVEFVFASVLVAAIVTFAILLYQKWKTPFKKEVETFEEDGKTKKRIKIIFDETAHKNEELLDDTF